MKVIEHLNKAKKPLISFEILPPLKGKGIQAIYDILDPLMEFKPPFIDVTYHRQDYVYKKREGGLLEKVAITKRPGTVGICAAIINKYKVDAVPHLICGGFTREITENALIDLNFLGIDNVLVIRGDALKSEGNKFNAEPTGNNYAIELLEQVVNMNKGVYLEEDLSNTTPSNFCIGVAGYPEKHFEAPNLQSDMKYLKMKVDAGADYIVTQMFYDNRKYFDFVEKCREMGIDVPIIPGLKPLTRKKQVQTLPSIFHIDFPEELCSTVEKCKDDEAVKQAGIEWSIQQCKELIDFGAPCLHFYTMGRSGATRAVAEAIY